MTKLEELVIEEATKLKQFATPEELNNLDYEYLDGNSHWQCIYGQMTEDCRSNRAYELIQKCCQRVYHASSDDCFVGRLNGKPKQLDDPTNRLAYYVSPIEKFLYKEKPEQYNDSWKIQRLVAFLKSETDVLNFNK